MIKKRFIWIATGIAVSAMGTGLYAQEAAPAADATEAVLEEIVVTSQRRTERLQDVPIAVTVLQEQFLVDSNVHTLEELNGVVPGFVTTNTVSYGAAPLSIRGIGGANGGGNFFADEPVAVYMNDVYIGRLSFSTADLVDIASIEVLRGPQGTLYGRNSTAGALLIKSARPTDEFEGYVRGDVTSIEEYRIAGALSGPLVDGVLKARAAFSYSNRSGFGTNTFNGKDVGGSEDTSGRLTLEWTPSADLTVTLIGEYLDRNAEPATIQVADVSNPLQASPFVIRPDLKQLLDADRFALNAPNFLNSETGAVTFSIDWDLGFATLDSITGYREYNLDGAQDSDGTAADFFNNNGTLRNKQWTQEVRLTSPADQRLTWIAGFFYIHENNAMNPFEIRNINALFRLGTLATFRAFQKLDAVAGFADATWKATDRLSLTVGARYSYERKNFNNDLLVQILNGGTIPPFVPGLGGLTFPAGAVFSDPPQFVARKSWNDFSPRAVIEFRVNENVLTYFSYSQGFKSGGFNAFGLAPAFGPENVDAFELGWKSDLADGRLRFNVAGFYYDYSDLQVRLGVPTGGVEIANAAQASIKGVEIEMAAAPVEGLRITGNLTYLDATFDQGSNLRQVPPGLLFPIGAPIPLEAVSVAGNRLSRAPKWQAYLSGEYAFPVMDLGTGRIQLAYRYQDNVFFLETNQDQPTFRSGSWSEVDLRISLESVDGRWEVAFFGRNITDDRHLTQVTQLGSFPNGAVNAPRRWGGQVAIRF